MVGRNGIAPTSTKLLVLFFEDITFVFYPDIAPLNNSFFCNTTNAGKKNSSTLTLRTATVYLVRRTLVVLKILLIALCPVLNQKWHSVQI